jgi:tetratricopeptide (TPR) repeat protein
MRFEVEPGRAAPFRVVAPDLEVEVLGTVFEVDGPEVRVERGRVRVTSARHDRSVELGAGERVRWDERAALDGPAAAASVASGAASASVDAAPLLARARRHLAAREVEPARRLLGQVLSGSLTPSVEAEAQTLLAECALVAGDHDEAARRYAEVAKRHGDLPAGETALFAAAREAHASGRRPAARQLFEQYLARYPRGQFVAEARSRLSQLSP